MLPSDDNAQVITTTGSGSSSCSIPSSSCTNNDCTTNSSALAENTDEEVSSVLTNGLIDSEDQKAIEISQDSMVNDNESTKCVSKKASEEEEKEQHHDREQAMTTQENKCSEDDQNETATTKEKEGTTEEDAASQKVDVSDKEVHDDSSKHPEPKSSTELNADNDIEWLSPFSMPRAKSSEDGDNNSIEIEEKPKGKDSAYKMLKKGAVGAVGGTMVGLGLVMIPLPTPFGAVVASSGLAVLGTEFKEAKELNDRLIGSAKGHFNKARDSVVKGIEKMNEDESDSDSDISVSSNNNKTLIGDENSAKRKDVRGESGSVMKVNSGESFGSDNNVDGTVTEDSETSESGSTSESPPLWLHMNPIERNRQAKLAKVKYRKDKQTSYEQAMEAFTRRTGKLLSRTLLPLIKKTDKSSDVQEQTADIDTSVTEKGGNLQTNKDRTNTKPETNEEEFRESSTIKTNDNDSDGYVVISQEEH